MNKNVLSKFLGKKKTGELNKFVQNTVGRNGLLVLWTISYEELTKLVQLNEKPAMDAPGLSNATEYLACFWADMQSREQA